MYAVIKTGAKQYRVEEGMTLEVERLGETGASVELQPVMVVDGDQVLARPEQLTGATVTAMVIDEVKGPKITGFTYKNKTRSRRRWGHRQQYALIEITGISKG